MKSSLTKAIVSFITAFIIIGGTSVSAAGIVTGGVFGGPDNTQLLTDISTFAGLGDFGDKNDSSLSSTFRTPSSILAMPDGSIVVSDSRNQLIRKISKDKVTNVAGVSILKDAQGFPTGGYLNDRPEASFFSNPGGLATDAKGNIYIADTDNNAIRKIDAAGKISTVAGDGVPGNVDGKGEKANFYHPKDVAVTNEGIIYVADTLNHTLRKIALDGTVTTLNDNGSFRAVEIAPKKFVASGDFLDGDISKAKFNEPSGLAIDAKGNLFISDTGNQRIRYYDMASGKVSTVAGNARAIGSILYEHNALYAPGDFADGAASQALFNFPLGLAVTQEGGLLIADSLNHSVRYLLNGKVSTIAGESHQFAGEANGVERTSTFNLPSDVAVAADGSILVADCFNNKIRTIRAYQLPSPLPADDSYKVALHSKLIEFDATPELINGRIMVPVRAITEALGYKVEFTVEGHLIRLIRDDVTIQMAIGKQEVSRKDSGKDDIVHAIDVSPYISQDRTYVPVRFFAEEIGLDVQWNAEHHLAILR